MIDHRTERHGKNKLRPQTSLMTTSCPSPHPLIENQLVGSELIYRNSSVLTMTKPLHVLMQYNDVIKNQNYTVQSSKQQYITTKHLQRSPYA